MLLQHVPQFGGQGLTAPEQHRHIGHEAANVTRQLAVCSIALAQFLGMAQLGMANGFLARLNVPAPIVWWWPFGGAWWS